MTIWRLVMHEIRHRRLNFLLSLLGVAVAVGSVVAAEVLMSRERQVTNAILSRKQIEVEQTMTARQKDVAEAGAALQDVMRKTMRELGFNILILPEDQDLSELHLNGTLSETMPESYVSKLASTSIVTVNHLLPTVTQKVRWNEREIDVILHGTRGEVPILHASEKKPLLEAVPAGKMVVGCEIHRRLSLKVDDRVTFRGREFTISRLHPERGSTDDVSVWIDLAEAQELLGLQNLIHAILALECECAGDRITQIRAEIREILPGTQVIERYSQALTRAEARGRAKLAAEEALDKERQAGAAALESESASRAALESSHEQLASVLVPVGILSAAVWVGLLAFSNARQRCAEIGILRAIGLRASQIQRVFLTRAVLVGFGGAAPGILCGLILGQIFAERSELVPEASRLIDSGTLNIIAFSLVMAPVLSVVAAWLPAALVARQDPALVLQVD